MEKAVAHAYKVEMPKYHKLYQLVISVAVSVSDVVLQRAD